MSIEIGINLEFIRCEDKPFEAGVARAAELGFRYCEPLVHNGRELLSDAGYFHSFSMDNEPLDGAGRKDLGGCGTKGRRNNN
jgi:hypothetical protein